MSVSHPKPELTENHSTNKHQKHRWCITLIIILLIELPQVAAAWVTLGDRMTELQFPTIEVIHKDSNLD